MWKRLNGSLTLRLCGSTVWLLLIYSIKKKSCFVGTCVLKFELWTDGCSWQPSMVNHQTGNTGSKDNVLMQLFYSNESFTCSHWSDIWREIMLILIQLQALRSVSCTQNWSIVGRAPPPTECRSGLRSCGPAAFAWNQNPSLTKLAVWRPPAGAPQPFFHLSCGNTVLKEKTTSPSLSYVFKRTRSEDFNRLAFSLIFLISNNPKLSFYKIKEWTR